MQAVNVWVVQPGDKQRSPTVQVSVAPRHDFRYTDSCVFCFGVLMLFISPGNMGGQLVMCFIPAPGKQALYTKGYFARLCSRKAAAAHLKVCEGW